MDTEEARRKGGNGSRPLMTNVLEDERYFRFTRLRTEQIIMVVLEFTIRKVIPPNTLPSAPSPLQIRKHHVRASITIKQRRTLDRLPPILTPLTLERLVRVAHRTLVKGKQLPQRIEGEVPFGIFLLIDDAGRESLLVGLALEDLLFDRPGRDESIDEALFLLTITPYTSQGLLVGGRVPVCEKSPRSVGERVGAYLRTHLDRIR